MTMPPVRHAPLELSGTVNAIDSVRVATEILSPVLLLLRDAAHYRGTPRATSVDINRRSAGSGDRSRRVSPITIEPRSPTTCCDAETPFQVAGVSGWTTGTIGREGDAKTPLLTTRQATVPTTRQRRRQGPTVTQRHPCEARWPG